MGSDAGTSRGKDARRGLRRASPPRPHGAPTAPPQRPDPRSAHSADVISKPRDFKSSARTFERDLSRAQGNPVRTPLGRVCLRGLY